MSAYSLTQNDNGRRLSVVDASTINRVVEFESPFRVMNSETIETRLADVWAPEVTHDSETGHVDVWAGWVLLEGYTGQYRYSGPCMHASEQFAGRIAADVLADVGGVYCLVVVSEADGEEPDSWAVARKIEDPS